MSDVITRAEDLVAEITAHLVAASVDGVAVTLDALEVPAALQNGPVVAVQPPELEYTGTLAATEAETTWELFVIAGPYADRLAAWRKIDPIMQALRDPLNIDSAKPASWVHPSMPEYPAYVLTFTETI